MSGVELIKIGPDDADQRLDRWLRRLHPHLLQGQIEKLCRKGEIRVDGGRVKASTRLAVGHTVRLPPMRAASSQNTASTRPCHAARSAGRACASTRHTPTR